MTPSYEELGRALVGLDTVSPLSTPSPEEAAMSPIRRQVSRLARRHRSLTALSSRSTRDILDCIRHLSRLPTVLTVDGLAIPSDRRAVVVAHGPSLGTSVETLRRQRERVHLLAPFRTAIHLAEHGIIPDVAVIADREAEQYDHTVAAWMTLPTEQRTRLTRECELVAEPLAPVELYGAFSRLRFFDYGLGILPASATLPFWGYALLTSVCLPLAAGATRLALVGADLTAADGVARPSWSTGEVKLDPRMQALLDLLEMVARCDAHLIDTGAASVRKRGYSHMSLEQFLAGGRSYERGREASPAGQLAVLVAERLLDGVERHLRTQSEVVTSIEGRCHEALEMAGATDAGSEALPGLVREIEQEWPGDPRMRAAAHALQPTYLLDLWRLREHHDITPVDPIEAARKKTALVFSELAELAAEHRRLAPELETTIRDLRRNLQSPAPSDGPIRRVGIVGTGTRAQAAARWLAERHRMQPAGYFRSTSSKEPFDDSGISLPLDHPAATSCDLLLLADDEPAMTVVADALRERGFREYERFLRFRPGSPLDARPTVAELMGEIDRLNVTDLDDLAQAVRRRVLERCSLRADYWITLYARFVHELRDLTGFDPQGRWILEIGTGSGFGPLILFNLAGARRACTVDFQGLVKPYAAPYRELLARVLLTDGLLATSPYPSPAEIVNRFERLVSFDGETVRFDHRRLSALHGSVASLPFASEQFDLVYSNAVLEHVVDVKAAIVEMKRVLRPGGIAAHRIDLSDHAVPDEPHQFLRYSDQLWHWLNRHHVYTENRLRRSDFLQLFEDAGFAVVQESAARTSPVTGRVLAGMHPRFQRYDRTDLAVVSAMMVLRKP